jgi:hypothetical protein
LKIPAGSIITATCIYDNTSNNPDNPNDPPAIVLPGQGTPDEMFFIPIEFIPYQQGDEDVYLGSEDNIILGDVNQDGILNILDVVIIVNQVLSNEYNLIADVNEDGVVNVLDVVMMVNILLGGLQ